MQLSKTTSEFRPRTKRRCPTLHQLKNNIFSAIKAALTYIFTGRGLFSSPLQSVTNLIPTRLLDVVALDLSALDASIPANRPDIELMLIANSCTDAHISENGSSRFSRRSSCPKSQGHVSLAAKNHRARPDVELGFFAEPGEYVPLPKGLRLALRVATELRNTRYPLQDLIVPGDDSDSVVDAFIRKNLRDCYHYASTCRIGTEARGPR
ncbi:hypothetical protein VTO73DRAFT_13774 [Trametes versicolor]